MGEFIKKFVNLARTLSWKFNKNINRNWGNQKSAHLNRNPCTAHPLLLPSSSPCSNPRGVAGRTTGNPCGRYIFLLSVDSTCHTTSLNALPRQGVASVGHPPPLPLTSQFIAFFLACPCPLSLPRIRFVVQLLLLLLFVVSPCPFVFAALCRIINFAQLFACQRSTSPLLPLPPVSSLFPV